MKRGSLITAAFVAAAVGFLGAQGSTEQAAGSRGQAGLAQQPTFRAGIDLVRVAAVVRDHKGQRLRRSMVVALGRRDLQCAARKVSLR